MSEDSFVEVTHESWFGRIAASIKGVMCGLVLVLIAFVLLFWNEGRAVKTARTLDAGAGAVVSVDAEAPRSANEGSLVHISGAAATQETLADTEFGMSASDAIKLRRVVELYQWQETTSSKSRKGLGGGKTTTKTYTYTKKWSDHLITSSHFKESTEHVNPTQKPYTNRTLSAENVTVGGFALSDSLISGWANFEELRVDKTMADTLPAHLKTATKAHGGLYYVKGNPAEPQVGDVRVRFSIVRAGPVSVVARQIGSTFEPYRTGDGGTVYMLSPGTFSAEGMFAQAASTNRMLTWILRLVGFVLMALGVGLVFAPLVVLADVIPFLGDLVGVGIFLFALVAGISLTTLTIAVSWLFYRPLTGILLIVVAAGSIIGLKTLAKRRKAARA